LNSRPSAAIGLSYPLSRPQGGRPDGPASSAPLGNQASGGEAFGGPWPWRGPLGTPKGHAQSQGGCQPTRWREGTSPAHRRLSPVAKTGRRPAWAHPGRAPDERLSRHALRIRSLRHRRRAPVTPLGRPGVRRAANPGRPPELFETARGRAGQRPGPSKAAKPWTGRSWRAWLCRMTSLFDLTRRARPGAIRSVEPSVALPASP
jgi:hypothetical protein